MVQLNEHKYLNLFLSLASNAGSTMYNDFNVLVLDCWFLIMRGTDPNELAKDQQRVRIARENTLVLAEILPGHTGTDGKPDQVTRP